MREQIEQLADSPPAPADSHPLDDFGDQHKKRNQKRSEELADSRRRGKGNGHGELHGHMPFEQVRNRFFEDRIPADGDSGECQPVYPCDARNQTEPDDKQDQRHEPDAGPLGRGFPRFVLGPPVPRARGPTLR